MRNPFIIVVCFSLLFSLAFSCRCPRGKQNPPTPFKRDSPVVKYNPITLRYSVPVFESKEVEFSLVETNYTRVQWKINGDPSTISEGATKKVTFTKSGCNVVEFWELATESNYGCKVVYASPLMGNDNDYTFDVNKIKTIDPNLRVPNSNGFFMSTSSSVVAPKHAGGFYVLYQNTVTSVFHVLDYSQDYQLLANAALGITGSLCDITATPWGFAFYFRESVSDKSSLAGFYENFQMKFYTVVMNNANEPQLAKEQLIFYNNNQTPQYGLQAMYRPANGKIIYAKGRLLLIFAHYNNFKAGTNLVDGHTGDTVWSFDENGQDVKQGWGWGVSHSMIQSIAFDGHYVHTSALGDAYPQNVVAGLLDVEDVKSAVEPVQKYQYTFGGLKKDMSSQNLPGNLRGKSCGRLGGTVTNGVTTVLIYSVKPCDADPTLTRNQIGFISYKHPNNQITGKIEKPIFSGQEANDIVNVRVGKWGNKIIVFMIKENKDTGMEFPIMSYNSSLLRFYMVVDFDGNVIQKMIAAPTPFMSIGDDVRFQKNGDLIWSSHDGGKLMISYLEAK